jgi:RNA polymerase sigma factor (sigma-70 family)
LPYLIRLPLNQFYLYKKIQTIKNDFELNNGYEPCVEQITIDEEISEDMLSFLYQVPDNLNDIVVEADIDSFESDLPTVDTLFSQLHLDKYLDILLSELTDREVDLIRMTYGIWCREMTLAEAGSKFEITQERVRQILEKALQKLTRSVIEKRKQDILAALEKKKKQYEFCSLNEVITIDKRRLYSIIQDLLGSYRNNGMNTTPKESKNIDDDMNHEETAIPQNKVEKIKKSYVVSKKKVNAIITSYRGLNIGDRIIYNAKSGPIKCEILEIYDTRNRLRVLYDNGIIDNIPIDFDLIFTNNRVAINRYKLDQKRRETERKERLLNNKKTWFDNSVGIKWIKCQLADKKTKYEIIQAFNKFHRLGYPDFSSKNGCLIDSSTLSLWLKELAKYEPDSWWIDGSGNYIYRGRDIVILKKFIDNYFKNTQPERPKKDRRKS